jgi:very-short-patch-repair endonuclease
MRSFSFPSVAGEGGAQRRMGCGKQEPASERLARLVLQWQGSCVSPRDEMHEPPPPFSQSSRKFARTQRRNMTKAETILWRAVRNHRLDGHGFRRQMPIGPYFADFVCLARKIVVEADGRTHETPEAKVKDAERDEWFRRAGFRVLRFSDELIIGGLPIVIERIRAVIREI